MSDQAGGFSFGHKKALHLHVRLFVFRFIGISEKSLYRSIERSRRLYEQGVDENRLRRYVQRWLIGRSVGYATGSVTKVALTGYGYLY